MSRSKTKIASQYQLHGQSLELVDSAKYLGVTVQLNREWDKHVQDATNHGNRLLGFMRRNLKVNSRSVRDQAYKMLRRQKLEYAATVWDPYKKEQIHLLERVERRKSSKNCNQPPSKHQ